MATSIENHALFRLNAEQYERMTAAGIVPEHGVELVDGLIVTMSAQGDRHVVAVRRLAKAFLLAAHDRYAVDVQSTAKIAPHDEPDPDIVISRDAASRTRATSDTIALIVEVAQTSLALDLGTKRERYAAAGIEEYWVVDLANDLFHIFRNPLTGGTYLDEFTVSTDNIVAPLAYPDVEVQTSIIFGH